MSSVHYKISKRPFTKSNIKKLFYTNFFRAEIKDNNDCIEICIKDIDRPDSSLEDFLELFEIPYDSWWFDMNDLYQNNDGSRYVRFEISEETGFPEKKIVGNDSRNNDERTSNIKTTGYKEILKTLENSGYEETRNLLIKAIKQETVDCEIEKANTPSKDRMYFLAAYHDKKNILKGFYDSDINITYKDSRTGITTLELIKALKNMDEILPKIKKDLLNNKQKRNKEKQIEYDLVL